MTRFRRGRQLTDGFDLGIENSNLNTQRISPLESWALSLAPLAFTLIPYTLHLSLLPCALRLACRAIVQPPAGRRPKPCILTPPMKLHKVKKRTAEP